MDIFGRMVNTQSLLLLFILLGVVCQKTGIITRENRGGFNNFLLNITLPAMILNSFLGEVGPDAFAQAGLILLVSALVCLGAWGLGSWLWRNQPGHQKSVLVFATMFSNAGNAGLPVISLVFGQAGLLYAALYLIPVRVIMWSLGVRIFQKERGKGSWKPLLLNPSILVVFLGLFLMLTGLRPPELVQTAIRRVGDITGPLAMILIGTTLAEMKLREAFSLQAWLLSLIRLVVMPLITLGALLLLRAETLAGQVAFVLCAMPVATNTVVLSERYGADHLLAGKAVFLSTLLSLLSVPLLTLLL